MHLVTDSELVYFGLQGKCDNWCRHNWVGSWGLAHAGLWQQLWAKWLLLGPSVLVQWVPSHVGVEGNERADLRANKGTTITMNKVVTVKICHRHLGRPGTSGHAWHT